MSAMNHERRTALRDGTRIVIRPVRPDDREALRESFERLSPESRYRRFLAPMAHLSESQLTYLTRVDHHDHEALVAMAEGDGDAEGEGLGIARFVRLEDPDAAEVAVAVADSWQGRGLGTVLLAHLLARARQEGIERFTATVLADNRGSVEVLSSLGRTTVGPPQEGAVELTIDLLDEADPDAALAAVLRAAAS
jgi:RimJ/RimL family protein N-acetyltransferase